MSVYWKPNDYQANLQMLLCPCGSTTSYDQCCGLFLEKEQIPQTPEQLMRSRYTAYSLGRIDYIKQTMKDKALAGFSEESARKWAMGITLLKLEVIRSWLEHPDKGFVEFSASVLENNQLRLMQESSEFQKEKGRWFYVDGIHPKFPKKVALNAPCPCANGKKYKNCHGKQPV